MNFGFSFCFKRKILFKVCEWYFSLRKLDLVMHKCQENVSKKAKLMGNIRATVICFIILHQVKLQIFSFIVTIFPETRHRLFYDCNFVTLSSTFRQPDLLGAFRRVNHNLIAHVSNRCRGYCTFPSLLTTQDTNVSYIMRGWSGKGSHLSPTHITLMMHNSAESFLPQHTVSAYCKFECVCAQKYLCTCICACIHISCSHGYWICV